MYQAGEYRISGFQLEHLLASPNDDEFLEKFDLSNDTIWDFHHIDTSVVYDVNITKSDSSDIIIGHNTVMCWNGGAQIDYLNVTSNDVLLRGSVQLWSVSTDCERESRFSLRGYECGNSVRMPFSESDLGMSDQFDYQYFASFPGIGRSEAYSPYCTGEYIVDKILRGTLITPFDTIPNARLIRVVGFMSFNRYREEPEEYQFTKLYWYHDSSSLPLLYASEFNRPLRDIEGKYVYELYQLLDFELPEIKVAPEALSCNEQRKGVVTKSCIEHSFDEGSIKVIDLLGRSIAFKQSEGQICLPPYSSPRMVLVVGKCENQWITRKVLQH
ncbi:MAG: hypothetical protein R2813_02300 [Flavobacteriales bacterium]